MILSQRHMTATLLIAMLLHGATAVWFSLPEPDLPPMPVQPLRINLLATIAETSVNAATEIVEPPPPVPEKPEPVIQKQPARLPVRPKLVEPPVAEVKPVENMPEPEQVTETVPQVTPAEVSPATLDDVATARYEQLLVAWLEKHKKYPGRAKRLRIEGEGILRILIDRTGQTQQVNLAQRTGNRLLDKAALEMAQRANPFPPMPENDPREKLEFMVPVAFMLR
ncbi:MAG: energy transducer TonB [Gammaproteobacteria bacterium]